jgi:uncharacterized Zn finger protein
MDLTERIVNHYIMISCKGCHKDAKIKVTLPTAIKCEHCGMIFDARLAQVAERKVRRLKTARKK